MADDRLGDIAWVKLKVMEGDPPVEVQKWFRGRLRQWVTDPDEKTQAVVELIKEGTLHDVSIDEMNMNDNNPN